MFERFTDRARQTVVLAQEQSRLLGHGQIDVGHLILAGINQNADELAAVDATVDLETVRVAIQAHLGPRQREPGVSGHIAFSTDLKIALEQAQRGALRDSRNFIDDDDLLTAALSHLTTNTVLTAAGVDEQALRAAVAEAQRRRPPPDRPADGGIAIGPGRGRMSGRPPWFAGSPQAMDRSGEIVDLLREVLQRLDTIIERMDGEQSRPDR